MWTTFCSCRSLLRSPCRCSSSKSFCETTNNKRMMTKKHLHALRCSPLFERDRQTSLRSMLKVRRLNGIDFYFQALDTDFSSRIESFQLVQFFRVSRFYTGHLFRKEINCPYWFSLLGGRSELRNLSLSSLSITNKRVVQKNMSLTYSSRRGALGFFRLLKTQR